MSILNQIQEARKVQKVAENILGNTKFMGRVGCYGCDEESILKESEQNYCHKCRFDEGKDITKGELDVLMQDHFTPEQYKLFEYFLKMYKI